jgi:RimJ/RimL family protein N-acetyltransferase
MIETQRLRLRPFSSNDLDALAAINADPEAMRYIGKGKPQSREQTQIRLDAILDHHKQYHFGLFAMVEKATDAFVGICGLQYLDNTSEIEVGYRLARSFWGRGLATEAARACLHYGFEQLGLERIVAVIQPSNLPSKSVVEKIGLRYIKNAHFYNTDVEYYAITREEFERLSKS